jgi:glutamine synthetase
MTTADGPRSDVAAEGVTSERVTTDDERQLAELGYSRYESDKPRVPHTLYAARDVFAKSEIAREAFGEYVVDHYLNWARIELEALEATVTVWEKFRGFERL